MNKDLLDEIAELYNLPDVQLKNKIEEGYVTENHVLLHGQALYFLKQYHKADEKRVAEIHEAGSYFYNNGIPVIQPIVNSHSQTSFEHDGFQYAIFPFVDGGKTHRADSSPGLIAELGKMLAEIHLQGKKYSGAMAPARRFNKDKFLAGVDELRPFIEEDKDKTEFGKLAYESMVLKTGIIAESDVTDNTVGLSNDHLIHGDYHSENVFLDSENQLTHVFDLDMTAVAPRSFELIRSMDKMCFGGKYEDENFEKAQKYLSAYNTLYPISKQEIEKAVHMYFIIESQSMWVEKTHYINKSERVDKFLQSKFNTLTYLKNNFSDFINKLNL